MQDDRKTDKRQTATDISRHTGGEAETSRNRQTDRQRGKEGNIHADRQKDGRTDI